MSDLRTAAQQALEALEMSRRFVYADNRPQCDDAIEALRVTLKQEAEAAAWLAERKEHWRKEREKAQAAKDQDPELSAALGWPGGISNPVLDRTQLLQMVAALRVSAQQALETLELEMDTRRCKVAIAALRAALAQQDEPVQEPIRLDCSSPLVVHPHPAFQTTPPKAEPVEPVAWMCSNPELMAKGYERFASRCEGDWNIPVYTSPPQRQPLLKHLGGNTATQASAELRRLARVEAQRDALLEALNSMIDLAEFWINHRQERRMSEEQYKVWIALGHESNAMLKARATIKAVEGEKA